MGNLPGAVTLCPRAPGREVCGRQTLRPNNKDKHDDSPFGAGIAGGGAPACLEGRGEKMPKVVLANAFSLSMLPMSSAETTLRVREITADEVKKFLSSTEFESAIGHESTAAFLTSKLGIEVKAERKQVTIDANTILVVFQLLSRLPEGRVLTEEEIASVKYKFYLVSLEQCSSPPQRG